MNKNNTLATFFNKFKPYYNRYIGTNLKYYIQTISALFLNNIIALIIPFITKIIIDDALIGKDIKLLIILLLLVFFIQIVLDVCGTVARYIYFFLVQKINYTVRINLFRHVLKLSLSSFDKIRSGELMKRLDDSRVIHEFLNTFFFNFLNNIFLIIVNLTACFFINPFSSIIIVLYIPLFILYNIKYGKVANATEKEVWEQDKQVMAEENESIIGIRTIKAFSLENKVYNKIKLLTVKLREIVLKYERKFIVLQWIYSFMYSLESFFLSLINGLFIVFDRMTIGELFAFQALSIQIFDPIRNLLQLNREMQGYIVSLDRMEETYSFTPEKKEGQKDIIITEGNIEFKDISFNYNESKEVLKKINLTIKKGETVALVGTSGVGKTTISNLIAGFYMPESGEIIIDGMNIKDYDVMTLRKQIGIVLQETYLFYGSILDNLKLSADGKTENEIIEALKKASAFDFIMEFPEGLNTKVGEKGIKLSGGQKQRISIAQAILKDPKILILDEATSHLDMETESKVQKALYELMKNKTAIIIAHRLSTIKKADKICVLEHGKIIATGTHDELLKSCNHYKKLYYKTASI